MARSLNGNHIGRAARPTVDDWMDSVSVDDTEKILTVIKSHMDREDYYNWFNGIFDAYYYKDRDKYIDQVRAKRQEIMDARAENDSHGKDEAIRINTGMLSLRNEPEQEIEEIPFCDHTNDPYDECPVCMVYDEPDTEQVDATYGVPADWPWTEQDQIDEQMNHRPEVGF